MLTARSLKSPVAARGWQAAQFEAVFTLDERDTAAEILPCFVQEPARGRDPRPYVGSATWLS